MTDKLKPCPFCGSQDGIVAPETVRGNYHICRGGCGAYGPDGDIGHWNDRPTERAAYLRGLEDAAKVADGMPQGVWHDEEGNAAGSRPATPREVAAAIRALAKED